MNWLQKLEKWSNLKTNNTIEKNHEGNIIWINGEFGSGKTTEILEWANNDKTKNFIYLNLLSIDLFYDSPEMLIKILNNDFDESKIEKTLKKINNFGFSFSIFGIGAGFNIGLKSEDKIDEFLSKSWGDSFLILDDIERINPQNIIKTLGLINTIRWHYPNVKIIVPYNKEVLKGIVYKHLNLDNDNGKYINKYVFNSIDFKPKSETLLKKYISIFDKFENEKEYIIAMKPFIENKNIFWRDVLQLEEYLLINNIDANDISNILILFFNKEIFDNIYDEISDPFGKVVKKISLGGNFYSKVKEMCPWLSRGLLHFTYINAKMVSQNDKIVSQTYIFFKDFHGK